MRKLILPLLLFAAAPAHAQTGALYLLCEAGEGEGEAIFNIGGGRLHIYNGSLWSPNYCEAPGAVCTLSETGLFALSLPEGDVTQRITIDTYGGAYTWTNGFETQTAACSQFAPPANLPAPE